MLKLDDSESNEMYPSFYGKGFIKGDLSGNSQGVPEKLIFGSDRDGQLDIYEADIPSEQSVYEFISDPKPKQVRKLPINSDFNDQMPFVYGDILVFSSNRPGGFGGFDLYYSERVGDQWAEPVNFGPTINSEFDEYRPVVSDHYDYGNRLMIFSSNRPGGLGGFDLYFIGIEKY
jgi:hypothetical protein